ncbi:MAG: hypothetical protein AAGD09_07355 [Cyanobacteria bacterium P01_F01_bin.56]
MYPQGSNNYQINFSGLGCWLTVIAVAWLLGAIGLGWIVKSIVVLFGVILVAPVIAFVGFRWWLKRNLIEGNCPVCDTGLAGLKKAQTVCPNCRTQLQVTGHGFERFTPEGTVEVDAVDVTGGNDRTSDVVDVQVEVLPPAEDNPR